MKLRFIDTVSFNQSEHTMYVSAIKDHPHLATLKADDVVLFVSRLGNQLIFILGFGTTNDTHAAHTFLRSERLRIPARTPWNPLMLQNYANRMKITLDGIKTFEEHLLHYAKLKAGKTTKKATKAERLL